MNIVLQLVLKYLKLNPKRTAVAMISVILSVFLLTSISNIFVYGFRYMKEVEVNINGSWQAVYNDVNDEQAKQLEKRDEFVSCKLEKVSNGLWQVEVELKKVDSKIFLTTQKIGEEIKMTTLEELEQVVILPNGEEAQYDISYHMALLDFYGITSLNAPASMKHILLGVLGIIMGISTLLIYSIFSLSFMEKKKYIGLLSCVGASLWQRRLFVFGEGALIGLVSVPLGLVTGCFGSVYMVGFLKEKLNQAYQLNVNLQHILDIKVTVLAAILGVFTIMIAVLVPTVQAGKVNALELIFKAGKSKPTEGVCKYYPRYSLEFNMALRNLSCNKQKCLKILFFASLSIVVAFNGYISIQEMQRKYLLQDDRASKELDAWMRVYSDNFTLGEQLKEKIEKMSWSEDVSYLSVLDLGAFTIDKKYVAKDLDRFKLSWWQTENPIQFWGEEEEHYGFPLKVVGISDESFQSYLELNGEEWEAGRGTYPVIIDDYIPVQKEGEKYPQYQEVLTVPSGEDVTIQFGTYADYALNPPNVITRTENEKVSLHVYASTSNRVPLPIMPGAYGMGRDDYAQMESYYIKVYMPYSAFQNFLQDEKVKKAYGELEDYDHPFYDDRTENAILNYICIDRADHLSGEKIEKDITAITNELDLRPYNSGYEDRYINNSDSWEYSNIESLTRDKFMKNATEILKRIFITGAILLILFFTLFSLTNYIITSIYIRKRELSVLKSMGMGYKSLKRMLLYENALLIFVSTVLGASCAYLIANAQFKEYRDGAATIDIQFPHEIFAGVVLGLFLLSLGIVLVVVRKIKSVNILDALKNENA